MEKDIPDDFCCQACAQTDVGCRFSVHADLSKPCLKRNSDLRVSYQLSPMNLKLEHNFKVVTVTEAVLQCQMACALCVSFSFGSLKLFSCVALPQGLLSGRKVRRPDEETTQKYMLCDLCCQAGAGMHRDILRTQISAVCS